MNSENTHTDSAGPRPAEPKSPSGDVDVAPLEGGGLRLVVRGSWTLRSRLPAPARLTTLVPADTPRLEFDTRELDAWDTRFLSLVRDWARCVEQVDASGLPGGVQRLLDLATAIEPPEGAGRVDRGGWLGALGGFALGRWVGFVDGLTFLGDWSLSLLRATRGHARFRRKDFWSILQHCGGDALPIVSLISFLVGLILALVGAVQLERFAAEIYTADLVALAMVREMGAIMTGIILAGRTGAAFAAQLGSMTVNEEIDALETMGISPIDFLVLPRTLALVTMLPLLCIYSDILGILGGASVGIGLLGLTPTQYLNQTFESITLTDCMIGWVKASVFGALVAIAGCWRGIRSGRSAEAVGESATRAVVTAIVWIIVVDAIATVMCNVLEI